MELKEFTLPFVGLKQGKHNFSFAIDNKIFEHFGFDDFHKTKLEGKLVLDKKNVILKTKLNNIWIFKSETELIVEDSILVDNNITKPTKQIVIKGVISDKKIIKKWSLEKI